VILRSSTPASIRLAVEASAAEIRILIDWPAKLDRLALAVAQEPARVVAEPSCWNTVVVAPATTCTRMKSALVALLRCARYHENDSVSVPVDGS
jgi:hypothetical protein